MDSKITKPMTSNAANINENDVLSLKRALNRLGYYTPPGDIGITTIPDRAVFDALTSFQKDHGMEESGEIRPGDDTVIAITDETKKKKKYKIQYTWRTVGDKKVREEHRELNGSTRIVGEDLEPGDDPGCRFWMDNVKRVRDCSEEEAAYEEMDKVVKKLSDRVNDLLLELDSLIKENNELIKDAQKSLGVAMVSFILTLPIERLGALGDLLREFFVGVIDNKAIEAAKGFMIERSRIKQKIEYKKISLLWH